MQSRKKRNQEIERNKRQKRRLSAGIGVLIVLAICAGIAWFAINAYQRSWIMTFEGQRIPTNELRFMMENQDPWVGHDEIIDNAMSDLIQSLTIMHHANNLDFGMTNEERTILLENVESRPGMSDARLAEYFSIGNMFERLFNHHVPEFTLDPADYQEEITEYIEARRPFYHQTEFMYILNDDLEVILSVMESMESDANADFGAFVMTYCVEHTNVEFVTEEPNLLPLSTLEQIVDPFELLELVDMQPGDTSGIIMFGESFLVLHMHSLVETPDSEIQESFLTSLAFELRAAQFNEIFEEMMENANFEINQRAFDAL